MKKAIIIQHGKYRWYLVVVRRFTSPTPRLKNAQKKRMNSALAILAVSGAFLGFTVLKKKRVREAVSNGDLDLVRSLLDSGCNVDSYYSGKGGKGTSTLQLALERQNMEMVHLLLGHGADVNHQTGNFQTPLKTAVISNCNGEAVQLLLEKGADPKMHCVLPTVGPHTTTILHSWCKRCTNKPNSDKVVESLLESQPDAWSTRINFMGTFMEHKGATPLHLAVRNCDGSNHCKAVIQRLLHAGSPLQVTERVRTPDGSGFRELTPYELAQENPNLRHLAWTKQLLQPRVPPIARLEG